MIKLAKGHKLWETIMLKDAIYYITSTADRSTYHLYKEDSSGINKIASASSPITFMSKIYKARVKQAS